MKVIIQCSKCFGNYPADLQQAFNWKDGWVYQYATRCLKCDIPIECVISEVEELSTQADMMQKTVQGVGQ